MYSVLFLGPRYNSQTRTLGGATFLFEELIDYLNVSDRKFNFRIISTNKYKNRYVSFLYVLKKSLLEFRKTDIIVLNANQSGILILWPLAAIFAKYGNIKIVLRCFGSDFNTIVSRFGSSIYRLLNRSDAIFFETKSLVNQWSEYHNNVYWMPNCRKSLNESQPIRQKSSIPRLIYMGRVTKTKGIQELILAIDRLQEKTSLSIYGPIDKELVYLRHSKYYCGELHSRESVQEALSNHDYLILPTYYHGEGYPGVIIESFRQGIPVIGTRWGGIPEMINDGFTGVLFEPNSVEEIKNAIQRILRLNYKEMASNCLREFNSYDSKTNHDIFINHIEKLCVE